MPGIADNALVKAAPLIERLAAYRPEPRSAPRSQAFLDAVLGEQPRARRRCWRGSRSSTRSRRADRAAALARRSSPTMIAASEQSQRRSPRSASSTVDCRLLPGQTPEDVEPLDPRAVLGDDGDYELESIERCGRHALLARHAALDAARDAGSRRPSRARRLAPLCCAGFTDSHWLREAFGTVAYGFFPMRTMEAEVAARLIHSADERTHVDDLGLGVDFLRAPPPARWRSDARAPVAGGRVRADRGVSARARLLRSRRRDARGRPLPRLRAIGAAAPHRGAGAARAVPAAPRGRGRAGHDGV